MSSKDFLKETSILLPTRAASSGATVNKTEYVVVDGMTPFAYVFSFCGMYKGAVPLMRPYRQIVYSMDTDSYYALGCNCGNEIYTLNCRFEETDKIISDRESAFTGISLFAREGCEEELVLSSPHNVGIYDKYGTRLSTERRVNNCLFFNSFVKTDNAQSEGITKGREEYIRITVNCDTTYITLPRCIKLKNLFSTDGGGIYGFFSKNYSNNYIVPIYENECVNSSFFSKILKNSF